MADYYFQMKDLSVGYNGNSLIRDINIGINKGEIVTLIGPNGSGKSLEEMYFLTILLS